MKKALHYLLIFCFCIANAQTELVFVYFKDKPNKSDFYSNPLSELSQKSLDRRTNLQIALNDQDAPIEPAYIQNIKNLGFTVTDSSKWLNGVAVNATQTQIAQLQALDYVQAVESFVKNNKTSNHQIKKNKLDDFNQNYSGKESFNYGTGNAQITQINLKPLHLSGYTGKGITIAVLDTGFPTVNTGSGYARLRDQGHIKGGYNFVSKNNDIYNTSLNTHGAYCLGVIGGYIDGSYVGSAPDADFYLYATESGPYEIPEEELYWIEAAEEADKNGVDIITASLGYANFFDDSRYNYTYSDMTGIRSFVARGAQIATEKGIFVLVANGNEGTDSWHYVITPADNEKVFSVGAVTSSGNSSSFSSYGPNYLGIIKPDASARGTNTAMVYNNSATSGSGTSFSTPLAAGGVACLLQALPNSTNRDTIKQLLRNTASLAPSYNDQMGYGILNFGNAYDNFSTLNISELPDNKSVLIYPNPNKGQFTIDISFEGIFSIQDMLGRIIYSGNIKKGKNTLNLKLNSGIYIATFKSQNKMYSEKIIIK